MTTDNCEKLDDKDLARAEAYRSRKATSVLAILFTDIESSVKLREELGEQAYEEKREAHDKAVRGVIEAGGSGQVVKSTGDGVLAILDDPSTAVLSSLELQRVTRKDHPHFRLRIGIDMGQVSVVSERGIVANVFGRQVNRAARIQALAEPQHVLTSFHVYDSALGWLKGNGVKWSLHGQAVLKGFDEPISILEPYYPPTSPQVLLSGSLPAGKPTVSPPDVGLTPRPIRIHPICWTPADDPIPFYRHAIALAVARLMSIPSTSVRVLWVDDYPQNNATERETLLSAGCSVDLALSTEEAVQRLSSQAYSLVLSDMARGNNPIAGLELLDWIRKQPSPIPAIIYASGNAVGWHGQAASDKGALLCTAGQVSLFDGILQTLEQLWYLRPYEDKS